MRIPFFNILLNVYLILVIDSWPFHFVLHIKAFQKDHLPVRYWKFHSTPTTTSISLDKKRARDIASASGEATSFVCPQPQEKWTRRKTPPILGRKCSLRGRGNSRRTEHSGPWWRGNWGWYWNDFSSNKKKKIYSSISPSGGDRETLSRVWIG